MAQADDHYVMPFQYGNAANPDAHYLTTGQEIVEDCPEVGVFVAGLGTGGTLMGVAKRLREHNPSVRIVAVEPQPGEDVQGLRSLEDGFVPPILDLKQLNSKVLVSNTEAVSWTRRLAMEEGIFAGLSSGANLSVAVREAERMESGSVVVLLPDGGWKYLSAGLWTRKMEALAGELEGKVWW
jgi:cysteine synthase B